MGNVNMEANQIHYRNNKKPAVHNVDNALDRLFDSSDALVSDINDLTESVYNKADKTDIAPTFSVETAYFVGDLVFESGKLWRFTANHAAGEWNQEEVAAVKISDELDALKNGLTNKEPLGGASSGNKTFKVGGNLELKTDAEGGNIVIKSNNNVQFEIDAYTDNLRIVTQKSGDYRFLSWDGASSVALGDINRKAHRYTVYGTTITVPAYACITVMTSGSGSGSKCGLYTYNSLSETLTTVIDDGIGLTAVKANDEVTFTTTNDCSITIFM